MNSRCIICNCDRDESGAGGLWDLSAEICNELFGRFNYDLDQDKVYKILRQYMEDQNYCCACGANLMVHKLKPCPFCGGEAVYMDKHTSPDRPQPTVECVDCGCSMTEINQEFLLKVWNRRVYGGR